MTPSALSHGLRSLEERLGLRLVNRTTRSVALTEAGERLFQRIRPAFRDIADAMDLNEFRGRPTGRLRLNAARLSAQLALMPRDAWCGCWRTGVPSIPASTSTIPAAGSFRRRSRPSSSSLARHAQANGVRPPTTAT